MTDIYDKPQFRKEGYINVKLIINERVSRRRSRRFKTRFSSDSPKIFSFFFSDLEDGVSSQNEFVFVFVFAGKEK